MMQKRLKIAKKLLSPQGSILVISIDEKRKIARVKTITSLEGRRKGLWYFKNHKLFDVRNGWILIIPRNQLKSSRLSGINHNIKIVSLNKLHYKQPNDKTRYPKRYHELIHRK